MWIGRYVVAAIQIDRARSDEVLVQVVDVFEDIALHVTRHADVVDQTAGGQISIPLLGWMKMATYLR